jgi:LCP family protein required for cell wall assembly
MKNTKKVKMKKAIYVILLSLLGLAILCGISAYFLIHNYINKMHLINTQSTASNVTWTDDGFSKDTDEYEEEDTQIELFSNTQNETVSGDAVSGEAGGSAVTQESSGNAQTAASLKDTEKMQEDVQAEDQEDTEADSEEAEEIAKLDQSIIDNINKDDSIMEDPSVLNILLIGSDTRISDERGRSDSMIILTINEEEKRIVATSFLRDIYLKIPGKENNRLNTAYAYGGADLLMETLELNFKFKIDKYIMVDFYAFIDIVDAIGGIEVEVKDDELETINGYIMEVNALEGDAVKKDLLKEPGTYLLNGKQALGYARNRYTANGDFDRTSRQREVLMAIYDKAKEQNLLELNNFLNVILPQITTNFSEQEILAKLLKIPTYFDYDMEQWSVPVTGSYRNVNVRGMAVLGIDFEKNIDRISETLYENE